VQRENQFAAEMAVGRFCFLHGNYAEAVSHYRLALQIRPNDPDATFGLAQALEESGRKAEAQRSYRAYLKAAPNGHFAERSKAALYRFEQSASR
jgi:Flp pilus assembly protein TadD